MKYTKENLKGIGIESLNREMSLKIIEELSKLGINNGWTGSRSLVYYGINKQNFDWCGYEGSFNKTITFEEFMNGNAIPNNEIIENFEIF